MPDESRFTGTQKQLKMQLNEVRYVFLCCQDRIIKNFLTYISFCKKKIKSNLLHSINRHYSNYSLAQPSTNSITTEQFQHKKAIYLEDTLPSQQASLLKPTQFFSKSPQKNCFRWGFRNTTKAYTAYICCYFLLSSPHRIVTLQRNVSWTHIRLRKESKKSMRFKMRKNCSSVYRNTFRKPKRNHCRFASPP